jgi:AbrB family looped-hinge helix DNA binding protein
MLTSKISKKGQIVIPRQIREKLNIKAGDELKFNQVGDRIYIEKGSQNDLPKLVDILKRGKPFPPRLVQNLRDEWQ